MGAMADAMEWLVDGQLELLGGDGEAIIISRGGTIVAAVGMFGRTTFRTTDVNARSVIERSDADLIVKADAWDTLTEPKVGDRVTRGSEVYEVYSPNNEPHFRTTDQFGHSWRVHLRRET